MADDMHPTLSVDPGCHVRRNRSMPTHAKMVRRVSQQLVMCARLPNLSECFRGEDSKEPMLVCGSEWMNGSDDVCRLHSELIIVTLDLFGITIASVVLGTPPGLPFRKIIYMYVCSWSALALGVEQLHAPTYTSMSLGLCGTRPGLH